MPITKEILPSAIHLSICDFDTSVDFLGSTLDGNFLHVDPVINAISIGR